VSKLFPLHTLDYNQGEGYPDVIAFRITGPHRSGIVGPIYPLLGPVAVRISEGESCYDMSEGLRISQDESLFKFYTNYVAQRSLPRRRLSVTFPLDSLNIRNTFSAETCAISFRRTLRVPESEAMQPVPSTFGSFPIIRVANCNPEKIPPTMRGERSLLIPMFQ
jgi:hypothetical protein